MVYIVSIRVPPALTKVSAIALDSLTTHLNTGKKTGDDSVRSMYISKITLRKQREPLDPSDVFLVLVHWDSFTFDALPMISEFPAGLHKVWVLSSLQ